LSGTKPAEADKLIDEAIAADPHSAEPLQVKGQMFRSRGDQEGAMRLFDQALKIDPKNISAHLSRADVNIALGKYEAADEDIDPILKASPNQFTANYLRGREFVKQQKYADADRIFDRISPGFATFWAGYYLQGVTKLALGQYGQAEESLGKYRAHVPDDIRAARLIATAALHQQAASRAIGYLKPLVDKMPADAAALAVLGDAYVADRKPDLALQQFEKAAALDPDNPTLKTQVGQYRSKRAGSGHLGTGVRHRGGRANCRTHAGDQGTAGAATRQGGGGRRLADQARRQESDLPYLAWDSPHSSARLFRSRERVPRSSGDQPGPYRRHTRSGAGLRGNRSIGRGEKSL
jgi:tetratricopeptide (TPR) repeat protein